VYPIGDTDPSALPVKAIGPAAEFYQKVLGFSVITSDPTSAVLGRDQVQIGLIRKEDHDPGQAGSCYFDVSDVDAVRQELEKNGGNPGPCGVQVHEGKHYRAFFLREDEDGYCFCIGQPA
jgi:predicted enzyme related to lactoylglutathione lyase